MERDLSRILISQQRLTERVRELGQQITRDYECEELVLVGVLKGAVLFFSDLAKEIKLPILMDFIAVSSYGDATHSSGVVRILKDLDEIIEGKHVLIVEDIVDTGLTLNYLVDNLKSRKPSSVKICCFLDKPSRRMVDVKIDYKGFDIPDEFVVGYGLDYAERYRNLPYICVLKPEVYNE